jgi:predicted transcriptional regulator
MKRCPGRSCDRREAVFEMTSEGMSTREVAGVLGVDQKTVCNDLKSEENSSKTSERAQGSEENSARSQKPSQCAMAVAVRLCG